jgi:hypothetical protein
MKKIVIATAISLSALAITPCAAHATPYTDDTNANAEMLCDNVDQDPTVRGLFREFTSMGTDGLTGQGKMLASELALGTYCPEYQPLADMLNTLLDSGVAPEAILEAGMAGNAPFPEATTPIPR